MSRLPSILALVLAAAGLQVPLAASPASADPGCAPLGTPACTILRPVAAPAHRRVEASAPSCVVTVGGLGSSPIDGFFDPLLAGASTAEDGRGIVTIRFGYDRSDRHPYDTYGAIDVSAAHLRSLVRDLEDECFAIDVVAHSMGGAVVDRAFSMGMSSSDGVRTYLPLASPHNGSFAARALRLGVELDDTFASAASAIARATGWHDPTSAAVGDLAEHRAPRPPRGVETVRQRLVTDLTVLRRDSIDRRYDVREYLVGSLAELEGHGGIARNEHVREVVARTLRAHAVPPDGRPPQQRTAASYAARLVERYWGGLVALGGLGLADAALGSAVGTAAGEAIDDVSAGHPGAAASDVVLAAGTLASRIGTRVPDGAELLNAARQLREPLEIALLKTLLQTIFE